jgi:hypothetical protein
MKLHQLGFDSLYCTCQIQGRLTEALSALLVLSAIELVENAVNLLDVENIRGELVTVGDILGRVGWSAGSGPTKAISQG